MAVPIVWSNGEKLLPSELNSNFEYLCGLIQNAPDLIEALNMRVVELEMKCVDLEARVVALENP